MKTSFRKGFTLIELLVVIAIIGILSAVVLASLNSARAKGSDAAIKSNVNNARAQAELYYDSNSQSYLGVCYNSSTGGGIDQMATGSRLAGSGATVCKDVAGAWVLSAQLKSNTASYWCVDSKGNAVATTANPSGTAVSCS